MHVQLHVNLPVQNELLHVELFVSRKRSFEKAACCTILPFTWAASPSSTFQKTTLVNLMATGPLLKNPDPMSWLPERALQGWPDRSVHSAPDAKGQDVSPKTVCCDGSLPTNGVCATALDFNVNTELQADGRHMAGAACAQYGIVGGKTACIKTGWTCCLTAYCIAGQLSSTRTRSVCYLYLRRQDS